jgi:hypothetical protein
MNLPNCTMEPTGGTTRLLRLTGRTPRSALVFGNDRVDVRDKRRRGSPRLSSGGLQGGCRESIL